MSDDHADDGHNPDGEHGHPHPKHELSERAKRVYAMRDLLIEKGVLTGCASKFWVGRVRRAR